MAKGGVTENANFSLKKESVWSFSITIYGAQ